MGKKLSEMSLEELWQLFPIILTEHQECWKAWYQDEEHLLKEILPSTQIVRISHIGSTAVKTIWAKPIIDILVEVRHECSLESIKEILCSGGYLCMSQSKKRISFNKGYTENGFAEKVFHVHLRYAGDNDELYFRDYLVEHPDVAKEYEKLKLGIWKEYEHDRDGYTNAKAAFVAECMKQAKLQYGNRYSSVFLNTDFLKNDEIQLVLEKTVDGNPEKEWLPAYHFAICDSNGAKAGICDLRIGHSERVYFGGNIGYTVEAQYRGHHYAGKACLLLFELAKKHGMEYLIITCVPENFPSRKTCEYAGGELLEIVELPEDNDMRVEDGKTQVCVYKFQLTR